jgi:hypothetical protein
VRERGANTLRADVRAGVPDQVLSGSARLTRELSENVAVDVERHRRCVSELLNHLDDGPTLRIRRDAKECGRS